MCGVGALVGDVPYKLTIIVSSYFQEYIQHPVDYTYNNINTNLEKHQTLLSDARPGSVPALELISRAASSVGVMYCIHGPNRGSNPGGGQIQKKINTT